MKRMKTWRWVPAALLLATGGTMAGRAEEFTIQSVDGLGRLTFDDASTARTYRVEGAPSSAGPWTDTWEELATIVAKGSGTVTCTVPTCYRVVATVVNEPSGMVWIPAGTNAGTDLDCGDYSLTVEAFYMDRYEVTKAQWDEVYAWAVAHGYRFDTAGSGKGPDHPVHTVHWYDCVKWCNARSQKEGRTPCYTLGGKVYKTRQIPPDCNFAANGYRLPTNTEWSYAARGGLSGQRFPWGNTIMHSHANYYSSSAHSYDTSPTRDYHPDYDDGDMPYTSPAGSFAANGYGLYDMAGNVSEWCWDASPDSARYLRGGDWFEYAESAHCGRLMRRLPYYRGDCDGFRTVFR